MSKYLFVYHGGSMPETEAEGAKVMEAWSQWLGSMGSDLIDGGNPVGPSITVLGGNKVVRDGGANPTSGYSIIEASSEDDAIKKAKGCPILEAGGSVELAEAFDM